jgi:hypothetical protein
MGISVISTLQSTFRFKRKVQILPSVAHMEGLPESSRCSLICSPPVNNLPPELLGIIFRFHTGGATGALLPLLLVCKYWHHVTSHTPDLWTLIKIKVNHYQYSHAPVQQHIQQIQLCVKKSGSLPLDLEIDYGFDILPTSPGGIREAIRRVLMELKGYNSALAARWASLQLVLPSHNGRPLIKASDCGLVNLSTPRLTKLSIEMLAKPVDYESAPLQYLTDLDELRSLVLDHEYILRHLPITLEKLEYLDIRLSQQPFDAGELARFPRLNTLTLRHEEKRDDGHSAFSPSTLELLNQPSTTNNHAIEPKVLGIDKPKVPTLYIQSAWLMEEELPNLMPVTLAWDPLNPSPLGQFKFTGLAKSSIQILLSKYPLSENLVLPGGLARPFFLLVQQEPALVGSLRKVTFDMGPGLPRVYNMINGRLRRARQRAPAVIDGNFTPIRAHL